MIHPPPLKPNDTIGIIAPSSAYDVESLQPSIKLLEAQGYRIIFHPQTSLKHGQMAGTPEDKVNAIHDYFADPNIKAILCTCGGNGTLHYLDMLDYDLIRANPKLFIGFSDITALLHAITRKTGLVTYHGPTLTKLHKINSDNQTQFFDVLAGNTSECDLKTDLEVTAPIYGGNLSMLQTLIGTPYAPDLNNAILFIEDINDHLSRYDRMLAHMARAGCFNNLKAIMIGDFINSGDNPDRPFGFTIKDMLKQHAPNTTIIQGLPVGHGDTLFTLPIGGTISLKNNKLSIKNL